MARVARSEDSVLGEKMRVARADLVILTYLVLSCAQGASLAMQSLESIGKGGVFTHSSTPETVIFLLWTPVSFVALCVFLMRRQWAYMLAAAWFLVYSAITMVIALGIVYVAWKYHGTKASDSLFPVAYYYLCLFFEGSYLLFNAWLLARLGMKMRTRDQDR
jgi:CDP-diglyceride synthetase